MSAKHCLQQFKQKLYAPFPPPRRLISEHADKIQDSVFFEFNLFVSNDHWNADIGSGSGFFFSRVDGWKFSVANLKWSMKCSLGGTFYTSPAINWILVNK